MINTKIILKRVNNGLPFDDIHEWDRMMDILNGWDIGEMIFDSKNGKINIRCGDDITIGRRTFYKCITPSINAGEGISIMKYSNIFTYPPNTIYDSNIISIGIDKATYNSIGGVIVGPGMTVLNGEISTVYQNVTTVSNTRTDNFASFITSNIKSPATLLINATVHTNYTYTLNLNLNSTFPQNIKHRVIVNMMQFTSPAILTVNFTTTGSSSIVFKRANPLTYLPSSFTLSNGGFLILDLTILGTTCFIEEYIK